MEKVSVFKNQFAITKHITDLPVKALQLTGSEKLLLITLSSYLGIGDNGKFTCYPSRSTLAALCGCKEDDITKRINKFISLGYFSKELKGDNYNAYTFISLPSLSNSKQIIKDKKEKYYKKVKSRKLINDVLDPEPDQLPINVIAFPKQKTTYVHTDTINHFSDMF